jgi:hypothetical protein
MENESREFSFDTAFLGFDVLETPGGVCAAVLSSSHHGQRQDGSLQGLALNILLASCR